MKLKRLERIETTIYKLSEQIKITKSKQHKSNQIKNQEKLLKIKQEEEEDLSREQNIQVDPYIFAK